MTNGLFILKPNVYTGIVPMDLFANTSIYPSPTVDLLNINLGKPANEVIHIALSDLHGKTVLQGKIPKRKTNIAIDIRQTPSGLYYLTLSSNEGKATKKVLIH